MIITDQGTAISLSHLESLDSWSVLHELDFEKSVGILEKSFLETHDEELRGFEILADHETDVLRVR